MFPDMGVVGGGGGNGSAMFLSCVDVLSLSCVVFDVVLFVCLFWSRLVLSGRVVGWLFSFVCLFVCFGVDDCSLLAFVLFVACLWSNWFLS